jgi:hypothetical protein
MDSAHIELIQQAIGALKLRDIMLYEGRFNRPTPPPPNDSFEVRQLSKREVRFALGEATEDGGKPIKLLQVYVDLGLRIAGLENDNPPVFFEIEADFMVEYEMLSEISESAIKAFADVNSVHNVWPFWRQHVFDIVARGRLPQFDVPLFSGIRKRIAEAPG